MSVSLKEIYYNTKKAYGLQMYAGEIGINNVIEWIQRIESIEELSGQNELWGEHTAVITTGEALPEKQDKIFFIEGLIQSGCCGLIVFGNKKELFLTEEIKKICNKSNFPLIIMEHPVLIGELQREYILTIENDKNISSTVSKIFAALLEGKAKIANHEHILREQGFRFDARYTCVVLYAEEKRQYIELQKMREWNRFLIYAMRSLGVYASFQLRQYQVVIVKDVEAEILNKVMKSFTRLLNSNHVGVTTRIGIGDTVKGLESIAISYNSAIAAARSALVNKISITSYENIGIYQLLLTNKDDLFVLKFIDQQLKPLIEYDKVHNTTLMNTLQEYFKNECSVKIVAENMHLHRNTVNKRIRLIKSLLSRDSLCGENRLCLELALKAWKFYQMENSDQ